MALFGSLALHTVSQLASGCAVQWDRILLAARIVAIGFAILGHVYVWGFYAQEAKTGVYRFTNSTWRVCVGTLYNPAEVGFHCKSCAGQCMGSQPHTMASALAHFRQQVSSGRPLAVLPGS